MASSLAVCTENINPNEVVPKTAENRAAANSLNMGCPLGSPQGHGNNMSNNCRALKRSLFWITERPN
jgi:hypothetical protein